MINIQQSIDVLNKFRRAKIPTEQRIWADNFLKLPVGTNIRSRYHTNVIFKLICGVNSDRRLERFSSTNNRYLDSLLVAEPQHFANLNLDEISKLNAGRIREMVNIQEINVTGCYFTEEIKEISL